MRHGIRPFAAALLAAIVSMLPEPGLAGSLRPRLGIEAAGNLGHMNADDTFLDTELHWALGGSAGLIARWPIAPAWGFEAGVGWDRTIGRETGTIAFMVTGGDTPFVLDFDERIQFDRIALPLRLTFQPARSPWSIEGGLSGGWLVHAARDADLNGADGFSPNLTRARGRAGLDANIFEDVGTFDEDDWTHNFHRWDLSALGGLGWDHPYGSHVFRARLRWQEGLTDMAKFDRSWRMRSASAALGLLF